MQQMGYTLIELVTVVAIVAIGAAIGVPNFRDTIQNNRIIATSNELLTAVSLARNAAIQQNTNVQVCASANPAATTPVCKGAPGSGSSSNWTEGWVVLADSDRNGSFESKLLSVSIPTSKLVITGTGSGSMVFRRTGLPLAGSNATLGICDDRKSDSGKYQNMRNLVVSAAGRARVETPTSSGDMACN